MMLQDQKLDLHEVLQTTPDLTLIQPFLVDFDTQLLLDIFLYQIQKHRYKRA